MITGSYPSLFQYADYSEHASLMLHTLVASLDSTQDPDFKADIMNAILAIAKQLGFRLVPSQPFSRQIKYLQPQYQAILFQNYCHEDVTRSVRANSRYWCAGVLLTCSVQGNRPTALHLHDS